MSKMPYNNYYVPDPLASSGSESTTVWVNDKVRTKMPSILVCRRNKDSTFPSQRVA